MGFRVELTAARIRRANPSIGKAAAREIAAELDDIVTGVRKYCARRPDYSANDENDLIQTIMRGIVDDPAYDADGDDCIFLAAMLGDPDDPDDNNGFNLFSRFIRLFDRVNGTDVVGESGLDDTPPPGEKPGTGSCAG